jgi:hypothetical protein
VGRPFDLSRDPYEVDGLPRAVVKAWVTMTLGHTGFHKRWPREVRENLRAKGIDTRRFPLARVQPAVTAQHSVLANWPALPITCFDLMFLESQAVVATMVDLVRVRGIPSLSVHDSIIVPARHEAEAAFILAVKYDSFVGVRPTLKCNRPT